MDNIIFGLVIGCIVGMIVFMVFIAASNTNYNLETLFVVLGFLSWGICIFVGGAIGSSVSFHNNRAFIETYTITKDVIENSIANDNLSGFERVELVKQAVEINQDLVERQYNSKQWYGFMVPDDIIELEPINLDGDLIGCT